jgi:hypothetical protein
MTSTTSADASTSTTASAEPPAAVSVSPSVKQAYKPHLSVKLALGLLVVCIVAYLAVSYEALPTFWRFYAKHHPAMEQVVKHTVTSQGILGDPINVAFIGTEQALHEAILKAGWHPADPITMKSSLRIAEASLLHRSYETAPVSDLFVWKKKQDLAFEQAAGRDPRQRHHVRFWRSDQVDNFGRSLWLGAATFDTSVGISHLTGQITHHIDGNVDKERDKLVADLADLPNLILDWTDPFHDKKTGKNGGGDPYFTDGRLAVFIANP